MFGLNSAMLYRTAVILKIYIYGGDGISEWYAMYRTYVPGKPCMLVDVSFGSIPPPFGS